MATTHATDTTTPLRHPLEPLSVAELERAVALVRGEGRLSDRARFPTVALHEPPKDAVLGFREGDLIPRAADVVVLDKGTGQTFEIVVDLTEDAVRSWEEIPNAQPPVLWEEWDEAEAAAKGDPRFVEACRARGIEDLTHVFVDPVSAGNFGFEHEQGRRLVRGVAYWRRDETDNGYAYPIEGLIPIVDLNSREVVELWNLEEPRPLPPTHGRYDAASIDEPVRADLKPLDVVQPEGPSFTVEGNELRWQKWRMRITMHSREGLVLHDVAYDGRPVLYRAALSEMVVPYGDPSQAHFWKGVFDAGEYGLGKLANSLELGCDCLGEIRYLDADFVDDLGQPTTIKNAVCIHEEDRGLAWKHFDARSGIAEVRRNRVLVVSFICTVGNYDYAFYWNFDVSGAIEHEVKATGIMQTQGLREGEEPEYGELVAPQLGAMHHQHLFNYRLDMMVDGPRNRVLEVEAERVPMGPGNEQGNAMRRKRTLLERESDAAREADGRTMRYWRIESADNKNALGTPTAYRLLPKGTAYLLTDPDSPLTRRAQFATKQLWVTRFHPDERYAAGNYPNQSLGGEGLTAWQADDEGIVDEDIVCWYTFGSTHFPRPEDWPVTLASATRVSFVLEPEGFFHRTPSLDVPAPSGHCTHHGAAHNGATGVPDGEPA
jgi:primary-amine oxidase